MNSCIEGVSNECLGGLINALETKANDTLSDITIENFNIKKGEKKFCLLGISFTCGEREPDYMINQRAEILTTKEQLEELHLKKDFFEKCLYVLNKYGVVAVISEFGQYLTDCMEDFFEELDDCVEVCCFKKRIKLKVVNPCDLDFSTMLDFSGNTFPTLLNYLPRAGEIQTIINYFKSKKHFFKINVDEDYERVVFNAISCIEDEEGLTEFKNVEELYELYGSLI